MTLPISFCTRNVRFIKLCLIFTYLISFAPLGSSDLLINVLNSGGEAVREHVFANLSDDSVTVEFLQPDGIHVKHIMDFTDGIRLIRVVASAEEELTGFSGASVTIFCFLVRADIPEAPRYIAPDAVHKLRQKNPGAVRVAEESSNGVEANELWVRNFDGAKLTPHASLKACPRGTLAAPEHINHWYPGSVDSSAPELKACRDVVRTECKCRLRVCVDWFPCGLKYCAGRGAQYRCGIRTCAHCDTFAFRVAQPNQCPYDL